MGKRSTIKMWGQHLYSEDTLRKLRKYHRLRNQVSTRSKIIDTTTLFDRPLFSRTWRADTNLLRKSDERKWTAYGLKSHQKKHQLYREIFGNKLDSKYDTVPYVDVVGLSDRDRPTTFKECIDFFYPMSGVSSYIHTQKPLTTTDPQEYNFKHRARYRDNTIQYWLTGTMLDTADLIYGGPDYDNTDMPVDLGEVTMMYIWFNMYKLLFSEKARSAFGLLVEPDKFLEVRPQTRRSVLSKKTVAQGQQVLRNYQEGLSRLSTIVDISSAVSKAYMEGKIDDLSSFSRFIKEKGYDQIAAKYLSGQIKDLVEELGLSPKMSSLIAGYIVGAGLPALTYNNLSQIELANINDYVMGAISKSIDYFKDLPISEKLAIAKAVITKQWGSLPRTLSSRARNAVSELQREDQNRYRELYTSAISKVKSQVRSNGARPNGLLLTLGIGAATKGVQLGVTYLANRASSYQKRANTFYNANKINVNPIFLEDGIELAFDSFSAVGFKNDDFMDKDWTSGAKPYCSPRNGVQVAEFAQALYTIFRPTIAYFKNNPNVNVKRFFENREYIRLLVEDNISLDLNNPTYKGRNFFSSWTCKPFNLFVGSAYESTRIVLRDMQAFSPFTQAYGFEPAFLEADGEGRGELRRLYGRNSLLGIIGSPEQAGWEFTTPKKGGFFSPNHRYSYGRITSFDDTRWTVGNRSDWRTGHIQDKSPDRTVNSQRRLNDDVPYGFYGYTSLGFDVATGIPVFNAQWPAMVSVLLCCPDALKKLASSGYSWAKTVESRYIRSHQVYIPGTDRFAQRQLTAGSTAQINLDDGSTEVTAGEEFDAETTGGDGSEDDKTNTIAVLGVSVLALSGIGYWYLKKKGKI